MMTFSVVTGIAAGASVSEAPLHADNSRLINKMTDRSCSDDQPRRGELSSMILPPISVDYYLSKQSIFSEPEQIIDAADLFCARKNYQNIKNIVDRMTRSDCE